MDIRVLEIKSSQIVATASAVGKASSLRPAGNKATGVLPVTMNGFSRAPMEKEIRSYIQDAVEKIAKSIPKEYY